MKVAVSSNGKDTGGDVSEVFGRCPFFIIARIEGNKVVETRPVENASASQAGGTGIAAARAVAEMGADCVVSGNVGPRALDVLRQFGIKAFRGSGPVKGVLGRLAKGELSEIK